MTDESPARLSLPLLRAWTPAIEALLAKVQQAPVGALLEEAGPRDCAGLPLVDVGAPISYFEQIGGDGIFGIGIFEREADFAPVGIKEVQTRMESRLQEAEEEDCFVAAIRFSPEAAASARQRQWSAFGSYDLILPELWFRRRDQQMSLGARVRNAAAADKICEWLTALLVGPKGPERGTASRPRDDDVEATKFKEAVRQAGELLDIDQAEPRLEKVVLARRRSYAYEEDFQPAEHILALRNRASHGYCYWISPAPGVGYFGLSPECLYQREEEVVRIDALAGTAPVATTVKDTERHAEALMNDEKERTEHRIVVDGIASRVKELCKSHTVPTTPTTMRLEHVQHLHTAITGRLRQSKPILAALHPTAAVCGEPYEDSLAVIASLEGFDRGLYAGAIGMVHSKGEIFTVALRGAHYEGRIITAYAGSGIVSASNPADEWRETERKLQALAEAL